MICPDCGHDNIDGVDACDACGQSMVQFDPQGGDLEQTINRHPIEVLVHKEDAIVEHDTPVRTVIEDLISKHIGSALVVSNGQLVGVFTERDVLNKVTPDLDAALERPVSDFMTPSPETITSQDSIAYALHAMDLGGYRHMPIVDDTGKPQGVLSVRDILRFLRVRFAKLDT